MFDPGVDPDLLNTRTNVRHRLPVVRFKALLHTAELKAGNAASIRRKSPHVASRGTKPEKGLVRHNSICKYFYWLSSRVSNRALQPASGARAAGGRWILAPLGQWARGLGVDLDPLYATEHREGGAEALGAGLPALSREQLSVFSAEQWEREKDRLIHPKWLEAAKASLR